MIDDKVFIRNDFLKKFTKLAIEECTRLLDRRLPPLFPEVVVVANWISEDLKKVMRIQETEDDEVFQFDGFVKKTGLDYEYDELCVVAVASNGKVRELFELYKLWFIEDISPEGMEGILESYRERLNKS